MNRPTTTDPGAAPDVPSSQRSLRRSVVSVAERTSDRTGAWAAAPCMLGWPVSVRGAGSVCAPSCAATTGTTQEADAERPSSLFNREYPPSAASSATSQTSSVMCQVPELAGRVRQAFRTMNIKDVENPSSSPTAPRARSSSTADRGSASSAEHLFRPDGP